MSSLVRPTVIFVLGGPGAGKGTQCGKIVEEFGFVHLSAGDLLRNERNSNSPDGELIDQCIKQAAIVPVAITVRLLDKAMTASCVKKFVVDGFPRNKDNLSGWNDRMEDKTKIAFILFIDCPDDVCIERVMKRSQTSGRKDDNEETLKKRLVGYRNDTLPIVQHYEKLGLVRKVKGDEDVDNVYEQIKKHFMQYLETNEVRDS